MRNAIWQTAYEKDIKSKFATAHARLIDSVWEQICDIFWININWDLPIHNQTADYLKQISARHEPWADAYTIGKIRKLEDKFLNFPLELKKLWKIRAMEWWYIYIWWYIVKSNIERLNVRNFNWAYEHKWHTVFDRYWVSELSSRIKWHRIPSVQELTAIFNSLPWKEFFEQWYIARSLLNLPNIWIKEDSLFKKFFSFRDSHDCYIRTICDDFAFQIDNASINVKSLTPKCACPILLIKD
jgi:hypothetical protein